jgi:hypothetical protein
MTKAIETWAKQQVISNLSGEDTADRFDEVKRVCDLIGKVRETFDDAAKAQGNDTIRKVRSDSGERGVKLSAEERAAKLLGL